MWQSVFTFLYTFYQKPILKMIVEKKGLQYFTKILLPSNNLKNERLNSHAIISQPKQFILSKEKSLEFDQERLQR